MGLDGDAPNCSSCGDGQGGQPNPIDSCSRDMLSCDNPCHTAIHNTVTCESLPSRLENFTKNFFGDVVRTEVNGQIVWSLPCGLDVGLPGNPRGIDEGLACYFLRLFNDGIVGLQGPQGFPGTPGCAGHNAYTVTLANFTQPSVGGSVQVQTLFNPAMLLGSYVFINSAGWYVITAAPPTGLLTLQLIVSLVGIGSTVTSGKLVVPSGAPGQSIPGPQGQQGIQGPPGPIGPQGASITGPQGPAGDNLLAYNGYVTGAGGVDYAVSSVGASTYDTVNFGITNFGFTTDGNTAHIGTYLVSCSFDVKGNTVAGGDSANFAISNVSLGTQILGAFTTVAANTLGSNEEFSMQLQALVTTTDIHQQIAVQAFWTGHTGAYSVVAARSSLSWFQIA